MAIESVSENFWFVFFAYAAAFAPWTIISAKDFISSTWKTVRATRKAGYYNLVWSAVPAIYVAAYSAIKYIQEDFEEACAAMIALLFALLHMLRTVWGLWQLEQFRKWVEESVHRLNEMGLKYELYEHIDKDAVETSEEILVNDSIVDNQIMHGEARCYLRYGDVEVLKPLGKTEFVWWNWILGSVQWIPMIGRICLDAIWGIAGQQHNRKLVMMPASPVKLWVRWATAFASQGMRKWMRDFHMARNPDVEGFDAEVTAIQKMTKRGQHFGTEVLMSAVLQLLDEVKERKNKMGPFLWELWDAKDSMSDGRVVKEELLRIALSDGDALPFGARQVEDLKYVKDKDGWERLSYDTYREVLASAIAGLPLEDVYLNEARKLNVEMLEWLAILLHLGCMSQRAHQSIERSPFLYGEVNNGTGKDNQGSSTKEKNERAILNLRAQLNMEEHSTVTSKEEVEGGDWIGSTLRTISAFSGLSAIVSWISKGGNRHVTMAGEVVDVWLALVAGEQISFLVEKLNKDWKKLCLGPGEDGAMITKAELEKEAGAIRDINVALERRRLDRRVADPEHRYGYRDHFVTFMGYRMESVRSAAAHWVRRNGGKNPDKLFEEGMRGMRGGRRVIVKLSQPLCVMLRLHQGAEVWRRRGVQCRLIWELQNLMEERMNEKGAKNSADKSMTEKGADESEICNTDCDTERNTATWLGAEVIMLLLLSFPSLVVSVKEGQDEKEDLSHTKTCCFGTVFIDIWNTLVSRSYHAGDGERSTMRISISPVCGPQDISIVADIASCGTCRLGLEFGDVSFKWRLWRDAFCGRLEGLRGWQKEHGIGGVEIDEWRNPKLSDTQKAVYEMKTVVGGSFQTWGEWKPFRVRFCRFEMETKGFLQQPYQSESLNREIATTENVESYVASLPVHTIQPVEYDGAKEDVLAHASVLVEGTIRGVDNATGPGAIVEANSSPADVLKYMAYKAQGDGQHRQALLMYEMAAIMYMDADALQKSIDLVKEPRRRIVEKPSRGAEMLHAYVGRMLSEGSRDFVLSKKHVMMMRNRVLPLCEELLLLWGDREDVCMPLLDLIGVYVANGSEYNEKARLLSGSLVLFLSIGKREPRAILLQTSRLIQFTEAKAKSEVLPPKCLLESRVGGERWSAENRRAQQYILQKGARRFRTVDSDRAKLKDIYDNGSPQPGNEVILNRSALQWKNDEKYRFACLNCLGVLLELGADGIEANTKQAMSLYERAIEEGHDPKAMYNLSLLLQKGSGGVPIDIKRSVSLYERAIQEGKYVKAMFNLAVILEDGVDGITKDPQRAARLYQQAIDEGNDVRSMHNLALLLGRGAEGLEIDLPRAVRLYERAIGEGKDVMSMINLAFLLRTGAEGLEADAPRAATLYERAIEEGKAGIAMVNLAMMLQGGAEGVEANPQRAVRLYEQAIEEGGDTDAMYNLAQLLCEGPEGVSVDTRRAASLFERAIDEGQDADAMYSLAMLLEEGAEGVHADPQRAISLYERAVEEGSHVLAMYNLALLVQGTAHDEASFRRVVNLYERAIDEGNHADAMYNLALLLCEGATGVAVDIRRAASLFERAINEQQDVDAMYRLALLLENGAEGVESDLRRAVSLYERAVKEGNHVQAMARLAQLLQNGADGVEVDPQRAALLLEKANVTEEM